jgi:hypothetical protein
VVWHPLSADRQRLGGQAAAQLPAARRGNAVGQEDEALDYCLSNFSELQAFMTEAARREHAVVMFIG